MPHAERRGGQTDAAHFLQTSFILRLVINILEGDLFCVFSYLISIKTLRAKAAVLITQILLACLVNVNKLFNKLTLPGQCSC